MDAVAVAEVVIRQARAADIEAVARLWQALVEHHRGLDDSLPELSPLGMLRYARRLEDQLDNPMARVLVAEASGEILGYVLGVVVDLAPEMFAQEPSGFLADIYVAERWRRSGIGRALVQALAEWFRERGLRYYEWHAAARNSAALAFWRSAGGREVMVRMRAELD